MKGLSPRNQLIACLLLAGIGLALFFSGEFRDILPFNGRPLGWLGAVVFVAAVWFCVDAVHRTPYSEDEAAIAPGEWQAWVGVAFVGAVVVASLLNAHVFQPQLPIQQNPEAGVIGRDVGTLFVAWLVLSWVLEQRWSGKVLADERDTRIQLIASQWGRGATVFCIIGIAVLLGFSDTDRLREFSYPFIAQMLMFSLLWGLWFDQLVAAILYWRDRRAAA